MPRRFACISVTAIVAMTALPTTLACAGDDFPIAGTYVQNKPCHGDGTDPKPLVVTIASDQIKYASGTCALSDKRQEGNTFSLRATCTTRSGSVLSGDVSFTLRDDKNLDMIDRDKSYKAVLNRCPG